VAAATGALHFSDFSEESEIGDISVSAATKGPYEVMLGGRSIGVKMDVKGVLVVGLEDITGEDGSVVNPGLLAGLQLGDSIISIDGIKVDNAKQVQQLINQIKKEVYLKINRKNEIMNVKITPVLSADENQYRIGLWVRDRTAGIGTMTYYDPHNNSFGALGHAITDAATGTILNVADGEILNAKVESVKQGQAGKPGEIRGIFYETDKPLGSMTANTPYGIFGNMYEGQFDYAASKPIQIARRDEIKKGKAYILSTLDGTTIEQFEISIEKINKQNRPDTKSMIIKVTDRRLLERSGGIIQGMSGSPIIQNNRLIGAVTHVFINDPQKGYAVFIEWMLEQSNRLET
jgi:stage IV sporulation protein B